MHKNGFIRLLVLLLILPSASAAAADAQITLMLDWFPNVDHLPIYVARRQGYFAEEGLTIKILSPSETSDALKLAAAGNVDIAVSYEPQTIIAAARGIDIFAFGRLIGHPLTTLLFLKDRGIAKPQDLEGKKIGYTVPGLMDAMLDAFAKLNNIRQYTAVNVGFAIVQSLTAGKVEAVMGPFKTYETVAMAQKGFAVGYFELEKWGIPDYDELIFVIGRRALSKHPQMVPAFRRALDRAIAYTRSNPGNALKYYFEAVPEADRTMEAEAFKLTLPYYARNQQLDPERWRQFADFALRYGLVEAPVDVKAILWSQGN